MRLTPAENLATSTIGTHPLARRHTNSLNKGQIGVREGELLLRPISAVCVALNEGSHAEALGNNLIPVTGSKSKS